MSSSHPNTILEYGTPVQSYGIKAGRFLFGMEIRAQESVGQGGKSFGGYAGKVLYTRQQFQSTFSIEAIFSTFEEKEAFRKWALDYEKNISNWQQSNWASYMRVRGPRHFDWLGILTEGINQSVEVNDVTWVMNLVFRGSMPTPKGGKAPFVNYSEFNPPSKTDPNYDPQSIYFYPSEMDLNVAVGKREDSIYNSPVTSKGALPGSGDTGIRYHHQPPIPGF